MKNIKYHSKLSKQDRKGILYLLLLLSAIQLFILLYTPPIKQSKTTELQKKQIHQWQKSIDNEQNNKKISPFNPNDLKEEEWIELGFSKKQAQVILKYKKSLGKFSTLNQIKKCFVISDDKFKEIQPYILLEDEQQKNTVDNRKRSNSKKISPFNPNDLKEEEWIELGFSKKQAQVILKYKKSLGGFLTLAQIKKCFVISDEKFKEIQPYILLENEQQKNTAYNIDNRKISNDKKISPFNPNDLKEEEWIELGFSKKQAQVILKYKKSLGGFSTLAQIKKCFVISDEKFKEIQPYILLENEQQKNKIDNKKISNDLNSCDINALVAVGIKLRDARRIFNYRKALGGFYHFDQLKEIHLSVEKITLLRKKMVLKTPVNRLNINSTLLYIVIKHPYISQSFVAFLKSSREKGIQFSSMEHLQKQYKGKITKKLMVYLSF